MNRYVEEDVEVEDILTVDPATERGQIERLKAFKADRDQELADAAARGAARGRPRRPPTCCPRSARRSRTACSVGEVCGAMRDVFGEYQPEI